MHQVWIIFELGKYGKRIGLTYLLTENVYITNDLLEYDDPYEQLYKAKKNFKKLKTKSIHKRIL